MKKGNKKVDFNGYNEEWQQALEHELMELKKTGGTPLIGVNGKLMYQEGENFIYYIRLYSSTLLEGSQIRLSFDGESYQGEVLFASKYDIEVKLDTDVGETIDRCEIYNEPWELINALKERLNEIGEETVKRNRVEALLAGDSEERHRANENKEHSEIISRALYNPTTYIWGPPGTGKTYTLTQIVVAHYIRGQAVLVLSHSNAAVDVLMKSIKDELEQQEEWQDGEIIRYGQTVDEEIVAHPTLLLSNLIIHQQPTLLHQFHRMEERKNKIRTLLKKRKASKKAIHQLPIIEEKLGNLRMKMRKLEGKVVDEALVVGATLSKCTIDSSLFEREYDLVVVDEISMAYTPHIAFAASLGKRIVVCGDFMQLPPIAVSRSTMANKWLKKDLFYHTGIVNGVLKKQKKNNVFILRQQRRMHPAISSFTNHYVYMDEVSDHPSVSEREIIASHEPFAGEAALFLHMEGQALQEGNSKSRYNILNALLVIQCMLASLKEKASSIGVVTPYRAQSRLLQALIDELLYHHPYFNEKEVIANTVHKFQGAERDIILFDTVDSTPQRVLGGLFQKTDSMKLINVAVTRSRGKFIEIGNESFLNKVGNKSTPICQLTNHLMANHSSRYGKRLYDTLLHKTYSKRLSWFMDYPLQFTKDIENAQETIALSCSSFTNVREEVKASIRTNKKALFTAYVEVGKHKTIINKHLGVDFCIIDENVLWLGIEKAETFMVRLHAPKTIMLLKGYLGIK
ncbi:MAG: DEAD/DEAH box helicase [Bacillaceae bacterium]